MALYWYFQREASLPLANDSLSDSVYVNGGCGRLLCLEQNKVNKVTSQAISTFQSKIFTMQLTHCMIFRALLSKYHAHYNGAVASYFEVDGPDY